MRFTWVAVLVLTVVTPPSATKLGGLEPTEDAARNQALLEHWRATQPDHATRVQLDGRRFHKLSTERQAKIRQFDHDLTARPSAHRARLLRTLERYTLWRETLAEADRQKIDSASSTGEKLQRIKDLREAEFLARLFPDEREELQRLPAGEVRSRRREEFKRRDRDRRNDWQIAARNLGDVLAPRAPGTPGVFAAAASSYNDLPPIVQLYISAFLRPFLTKDEEERLLLADGQWPRLLRTIVELSDKHRSEKLPLELPGTISVVDRVDRWDKLSGETQAKLREADKKFEPRVRHLDNQWPWFALAVGEFARNHKITLTPPLGPCQQRDFPFLLALKLPGNKGGFFREWQRELDKEDKERLHEAEGQWPAYPLALLLIARKHNLKFGPRTGSTVVPLPGPDLFWDRYRIVPRHNPDGGDSLPDVADSALREFVRFDLSPEQRGALTTSLREPAGRDQARRLYFTHYPDELDRLRQADQQLLLDPPAKPQ